MDGFYCMRAADPTLRANIQSNKRNRFARTLCVVSIILCIYISHIGSSCARLDWIHVNHPSRYIIHIMQLLYLKGHVRFFLRVQFSTAAGVHLAAVAAADYALLYFNSLSYETIHMQMHRHPFLPFHSPIVRGATLRQYVRTHHAVFLYINNITTA